MEITQYIHRQSVAVERRSTNHRLHCYLVITSLFLYVKLRHRGIANGASQLPDKRPPSLPGRSWFFFYFHVLSLSPPALFFCRPRLGRQKEVRATEVLFFIFYYLFMDFSFNIHAFFFSPGLSGCRVEFSALKATGAQKKKKRERRKSGFSSNELSGWWREESGRGEDREGDKRAGFHVFSGKWEAGLEGDRLCLLLICQPVNGERRRGELSSRDHSTQAWEQEGAPSNKLCHATCACPYRFTDNPALHCTPSCVRRKHN